KAGAGPRGGSPARVTMSEAPPSARIVPELVKADAPAKVKVAGARTSVPALEKVLVVVRLNAPARLIVPPAALVKSPLLPIDERAPALMMPVLLVTPRPVTSAVAARFQFPALSSTAPPKSTVPSTLVME